MPVPPWKITRSLIRNLMHAAQNVYPDEFIALLSVTESDPHLISEFVVIPAEFGRTHSQLHEELIPTDPLIVGSVHSHPSPSARASEQDLIAFSRLGEVHLILRHPYSESSFRAYLRNGKSVTIPLV